MWIESIKCESDQKKWRRRDWIIIYNNWETDRNSIFDGSNNFISCNWFEFET